MFAISNLSVTTQVDGVDEDNILFAPEIGKLRALYAAAHKEVAKAERAERCREEMEEAEVLARAKTEAKEAAKEAAKDALKEKDCRKVPAKTKVALEEALGQKHPGTPGLTGKQHSSTGRSFLQLLLKAKKEGSYDLPRWEDRCPFCCTKLEQTKNRSLVLPRKPGP